jgi:hypothetical protein
LDETVGDFQRKDGLMDEGFESALACIAHFKRYREGNTMLFRVVTATGLLLLASHAIAAPTKLKPASALVITNARGVPATDIAIGANGQTVRIKKPLAPQAKATLKLPKLTGCQVAVAASFPDEASIQMDDFDVCKDNNIRLTD